MFSFWRKPSQPDEKSEINPEMLRSIFELPLADHLPGPSSEWIYDVNHWEIDAGSKAMFNRAREGQGFSAIVFIEQDSLRETPKAKIVLFAAFNGLDGLPKEDKLGVAYTFLEYVESSVELGQSGSGVIHKASIQKYALKKELENSDSLLSQQVAMTMQQKHLTDQNAVLMQYQDKLFSKVKDSTLGYEGLTFGLSLIKGVEDITPDNYTLILLKNETHPLREYFQQKNTYALSSYAKEKKYLILIPNEQNKNSYEVYYIVNQKMVRRPSYQKESRGPIVTFTQTILENIEKNKVLIIETALKALNLFQPIFINNKSASQNNASIIYDFDFESFTMYADPDTYLLDENKKLTPEGRESGSLYNLQRSVPLALMTPFCHTLSSQLPEVKMNQQEIDKQKLRCMNWKKPVDTEIIKHFQRTSPEEKLMVFANNIHVTFRLYLETLKIFFNAYQITKEVDGLLDEQQAAELDHPSFKGMLRIHNGIISVNEFLFGAYLHSLHSRLNHLLLSFHKAKDITHNTVDLLKSERFIPRWIQQMGDFRILKNVIGECKAMMGDAPQGIGITPLLTGLQIIEKRLINIDSLRAEFKSKAEECAKTLCRCTQKQEVTQHFIISQYSLLHYIRCFSISKQEITHLLKIFLQVTDEMTGKTALENAVEKGWYDTALMLVSHGANPFQHNKKTNHTVFDVLFDKLKSASPEETNDIDHFLFHLKQKLGDEEMADVLNNLRATGCDLPKSMPPHSTSPRLIFK